MYINVYNNMRGGAYDINDKRIPPINTQTDIDKIMAVDNNGNLSPVSNKGLFDLSSSDAGKLLTISSDGNITPSTTTLVNLFMHYVYFQATISNDTKTVVCTQIITQDYSEFNAQNFVDYVNLILDPNKSNDGIPCTGSVRISGVDHKQCVQIRSGTVATGQPTASIKLMPIQATGGFDTAQDIPVSVITTIEDSIVRIF